MVARRQWFWHRPWFWPNGPEFSPDGLYRSVYGGLFEKFDWAAIFSKKAAGKTTSSRAE